MACGVSVATNYYAQAPLPAIGADLHVPAAVTGSLVTIAQLGYATGIVFLVPLGDLLPRRRVLPSMLMVVATGLLIEAAAPNFTAPASMGASRSASHWRMRSRRARSCSISSPPRSRPAAR